MKFSVGLQYGDESFLEEILKYRGKIDEVYFSWGDMASGRGRADTGKGLPPWETMELQLDALRRLSGAGVRLNLLFNAECYGEKSLARSLYEKIGDVTDYVRSRFGLASVTTTSPTIARFVRDNFPDLHVRASVNMEIGTVEAMEYLGDLFDGFYVKREYNRDLDRIRALHAWCELETTGARGSGVPAGGRNAHGPRRTRHRLRHPHGTARVTLYSGCFRFVFAEQEGFSR